MAKATGRHMCLRVLTGPWHMCSVSHADFRAGWPDWSTPWGLFVRASWRVRTQSLCCSTCARGKAARVAPFQVSALSGLTALRWLDLNDNSMSDISALIGLTSLDWLLLDNNSITVASLDALDAWPQPAAGGSQSDEQSRGVHDDETGHQAACR